MSLFSAKFIQTCQLLKHINAHELALLEPYFYPWKIPKQTVLINEGDSCDYLFVVIYGQLKVSKKMPFNASTHSLGEYKAGDFFGELAFLDGALRSANVTTITDSLIAKISANDIKALLNNEEGLALFGKLMLNVSTQLASHLRATNEQLIAALHGEFTQAQQRIEDNGSRTWSI